MHALLDSGQVIDMAIQERSTFCSDSTFWVFVLLQCEAPSNQIWGTGLNLSRLDCSVHLRIHATFSVSSQVINKYKEAHSTGSDRCPCQNITLPCFTEEDNRLFLSSSTLSSSHYSGRGLYVSHPSTGPCCRTLQSFLRNLWWTVTWPFCSSVL